MDAAEKILSGAIDMHIHAGPDPIVARSVDALEASRQAQQAGMRAIVLKSHDYPTAPLAQIVNKIVPDFMVLGSLSLDSAVGGLNVHALEASARMGAKVVWMPTFSSAHDTRRRTPPQAGIRIVDDSGKLLPVVHDILDIVRTNAMVVATGHVSPEEAFTLADAANKAGIWRIVATHPLLERMGCHLSVDEQRAMAERGVFIEHCFCETFGPNGLDPMRIIKAVRAVGAERCIMSTDLGQLRNPRPAEGMRMAIATILKLGLSETEVELMVKVNPARLLGLDG